MICDDAAAAVFHIDACILRNNLTVKEIALEIAKINMLIILLYSVT